MSSHALKVGIVGLPNVGKSTLFNALLKKRVALSASYPFATIEPSTGVVAVPDERLEKLAELVKNEEKLDHLPPLIFTTVEFVDIAGLVKGASQGEGLGNQFLSHIREVDAIIHVLRDFSDDMVIRVGADNPEADKDTVETELALADLQTLEKLIEAQEKEDKVSKDPLETQKLQLLRQIQTNLEQGKILGNYQVGDERLRLYFERLPLLSIKPVLYVFNVDEGSYAHKLEHEKANLNQLVISAKVEQDLAELSLEDQRQYLASLGVSEIGLNRLIKKSYVLLNLISYLTAGVKEVRAWTVQKGTRAPEAAAKIHTDFEKKFIRAEVIGYDKLIKAGSYKIAREKGLIKTEGKNYEVKDGDVVKFLVGS